MKKLRKFHSLVAVLGAGILFGVSACDGGGPTGGGGGGGGGGDDGPSRSASFSSTEAVWNSEQEVLWIESDVTIKGYADRDRLTVAGYWYRKAPDGQYYYIQSSCDTNVPKDVLGHQFLIQIKGDLTKVRSQQFGAVTFSCMKNRSGEYFGRAKLYDSKSIGIDPNTTAIAKSRWVGVIWSSPNPVSGIQTPIVRSLTEEESQALESGLMNAPAQLND
jgi:hypothetical protein